MLPWDTGQRGERRQRTWVFETLERVRDGPPPENRLVILQQHRIGKRREGVELGQRVQPEAERLDLRGLGERYILRIDLERGT